MIYDKMLLEMSLRDLINVNTDELTWFLSDDWDNTTQPFLIRSYVDSFVMYSTRATNGASRGIRVHVHNTSNNYPFIWTIQNIYNMRVRRSPCYMVAQCRWPRPQCVWSSLAVERAQGWNIAYGAVSVNVNMLGFAKREHVTLTLLILFLP